MKPLLCLFLAASPVFATGALDQRITNLEQQMEEVRICSVLGNSGAKTAPATSDIDGPVSFFSLEMLYWKPFIGGSDFAFTNDSFPVANPYMGNFAEINSDWHFGFRAGLGYRFSNIDWVVNAKYTRLKTASLEHTSVNGGISASGLFLASSETSAKAKWTVSFNVLDVDLSRPYFLRPRFSLEPRIGLRSAWIIQRDHAQYFNASNGQSRLLKYVNSASGIGIFGGTRMGWHWSREWSLYGGASASLIYGKMNVAAKSMNLAIAPAVPLDISADTYKVLPNMGLDAGLQWQMCWKVVCLSLAAGYDFQYWWRQNQRPHLDANTYYSWIRHAEDLGFQGFKLSAALDY